MTSGITPDQVRAQRTGWDPGSRRNARRPPRPGPTAAARVWAHLRAGAVRAAVCEGGRGLAGQVLGGRRVAVLGEGGGQVLDLAQAPWLCAEMWVQKGGVRRRRGAAESIEAGSDRELEGLRARTQSRLGPKEKCGGAAQGAESVWGQHALGLASGAGRSAASPPVPRARTPFPLGRLKWPSRSRPGLVCAPPAAPLSLPRGSGAAPRPAHQVHTVRGIVERRLDPLEERKTKGKSGAEGCKLEVKVMPSPSCPDLRML